MSSTAIEREQKTGGWIVPTLVTVIGGFMAILDSSIVNVAIPTMMNDYHTTMSKIQWVTTIYMLTLGVVVPTCGWLGDKLGFKKLYIYALIIFTVGSALCSLATTENFLIGARIIQAVGGGMIMPTMMTMMYSLVPKGKVGSASGLIGLTMMVAPAIGPTLGGYLVEYVNWRWIFTINLPVGVIGVFLAIVVLPDLPSREAGRFDILGFLTSSSGLFCLLLALSQGQDWGWTSLPVVLLLWISTGLLGIFVFHELTTENPLLELRVFKNPTFVLGNFMAAILNIVMFGSLFYVPFFLQSICGLGALTVGVLMLPPALVSAVMLPLAGVLYDRVGPRVPIALGILISTIAAYLFTRIDINTPLSTIIYWNMVRSAGMGLAMMPMQNAMMMVLPEHLMGRGSSITNIISRVASSLGLAVLTLFVTNRIAIYSAYLTWNVSGQAVNDLLISGAMSQQGIQTLLGTVIAQTAFVKAIDEMFMLTAVLSLLSLFPSLLFKKSASRPKQAAGAAME